MSTDDAFPVPDRSGLRSFGLQMAALVSGVFGLLLPWMLDSPCPAWPWLIAATFALLAVAAAQFLAPVYTAWMAFARGLNRITSPLIIGLLFVIAIVPAAMVMKVAGRDTMRRKPDPGLDSYRIASDTISASDMEKPY